VNILKGHEIVAWINLLSDYATGKKEWNTACEFVCEAHPMMPFEQGLGFDCQCGGPGMPPYRPKDSECLICGSPLEENGTCSDIGDNNCQYIGKT
jgi:hypothetical protein